MMMTMIDDPVEDDANSFGGDDGPLGGSSTKKCLLLKSHILDSYGLAQRSHFRRTSKTQGTTFENQIVKFRWCLESKLNLNLNFRPL